MLTWKDIENFVKNGVSAPENKVIKTEEEWKKLLSDDVFYITRQSGTEHAFSSAMCSRFEPGIYACACCGTLLFDASEKFDSQSGWPSFTQPLQENSIAYTADTTHIMTRIEALNHQD
jgi:methionine-R-sulfoxide reductase